MEVWPITLTTVEAALSRDPDLTISTSRPTAIPAFFMSLMYRNKLRGRGFLPPYFRRTMTKVDDRLPEMTQGLGVVDGTQARYYPLSEIGADGIRDRWGTRSLILDVGGTDGVPAARWADDGSLPFQLLSRWYGFSLTFPDCEIWGLAE